MKHLKKQQQHSGAGLLKTKWSAVTQRAIKQTSSEAQTRGSLKSPAVGAICSGHEEEAFKDIGEKNPYFSVKAAGYLFNKNLKTSNDLQGSGEP